MPRTKGSKNHAQADFDAQIAKLQKDKALLEGWKQRRQKLKQKQSKPQRRQKLKIC